MEPIDSATWRKASYSATNGGGCVEAGVPRHCRSSRPGARHHQPRGRGTRGLRRRMAQVHRRHKVAPHTNTQLALKVRLAMGLSGF